MDPDALRRLAIDKSLGELSGDAAALFDNYVTEHPDAAAMIAGATDTLATVRSALGSPMPTAGDPPMPPLRLRGTSNAEPAIAYSPARPTLTWLRRTAVAAAIVFAFLLGTQSGSPPISSGPQPNLMAVGETQSNIAADSSGFWSVERIINTEQPPVRRSAPGLKRSSPWTLLPTQGEQS